MDLEVYIVGIQTFFLKPYQNDRIPRSGENHLGIPKHKLFELLAAAAILSSAIPLSSMVLYAYICVYVIIIYYYIIIVDGALGIYNIIYS